MEQLESGSAEHLAYREDLLAHMLKIPSFFMAASEGQRGRAITFLLKKCNKYDVFIINPPYIDRNLSTKDYVDARGEFSKDSLKIFSARRVSTM